MSGEKILSMNQAALIGSLIERELQRLWRRPWFRWAPILPMALVLLVWGFVAHKSLFFLEGVNAPPSAALLMPLLLQDLFWTLLALELLLIPLFAAGSLSEERRTGGIELLLLAGFTPTSLLVAEFGFGVALFTYFLAALSPAILILTLPGGVGWGEVVASLWALWTFGLVQVGFATMGAAFSGRAQHAVLGALALGTALAIFWLWPGRNWPGNPIALLDEAIRTHRGRGLEMLLSDLFHGRVTAVIITLWQCVASVFLMQAVLAGGALLVARKLLLSGEDRFLRQTEPGTRLSRSAAARKLLEDERTDPVAWLEARGRWSGAAHFLLKLLFLYVGLGAVAMLFNPILISGGFEIHRLLLFGEAVGVLLLAGILGVESLAGERDRGTLDLLLLTPLGNAEILRGKMAGALRALVPFLLLPTLHAGLITLTGILRESSFWLFVGSLVFSAPLFYLIGFCVSAGHSIQRAIIKFLFYGGTLLFAPFLLTGFLLHWKLLPEEFLLQAVWRFSEFISPGPMLYHGLLPARGSTIEPAILMFWLRSVFYIVSTSVIGYFLSLHLRTFLEWADQKSGGEEEG